MREYRLRANLTQQQVAERSSVKTPQYLSALENGRYDVRKSEHFAGLARLYRLSPEEARDLNPELAAIFAEPQRGGAVCETLTPEDLSQLEYFYGACATAMFANHPAEPERAAKAALSAAKAMQRVWRGSH